jgi:2-polyprenyl-6-methoxyphenol hydroxylase-like FAD-dependent oxidoreductase
MGASATNQGTAVDVAIVGYGPTDQVLALLLGRLGHRVAVIERWPDLYPLPRAVHFNHEIARILQSDDVLPITERVDFYEWRNEKDEVLLQLDWSGVGCAGRRRHRNCDAEPETRHHQHARDHRRYRF